MIHVLLGFLPTGCISKIRKDATAEVSHNIQRRADGNSWTGRDPCALARVDECKSNRRLGCKHSH